MKNKKTLIIIGIIVITLITAGVVGILYFTTDLFKTEQQLFYKYLAQTKIMDTAIINNFKESNERIVGNSNSSLANLEISQSTINQETGIADIKNILNVKSNGLKNNLLNQGYRDFTFSSNNENFLTLKYIKDNNMHGVFADNIVSKYLAIENSNLKDFFAKLGVEDISNIPDSIQINNEEILSINNETLEQIKQKYGDLIYNNIKEENFFKVTNQDKTQTIGVSLSEQEFFDIIKLLLETIKDDTALLNFIINEVQKENNNITIEDIQSMIQNYIDIIVNETYSIDKDFMKFSLIKKEKNVISLILESNFVNETISQNEELNSVEQKNSIKIEINFSETNKINILANANNDELVKVEISYSYDNSNIDFRINYENNIKYNKINSFKIQYKINNYQTDNIFQSLILDISDVSKVNLNVKITNNIELKEDVQISKLTTENSEKLNDLTSEELGQLIIALKNRINYLYGENFIDDGSILNKEKTKEEYEKEYEEIKKAEQQILNQYKTFSD